MATQPMNMPWLGQAFDPLESSKQSADIQSTRLNMAAKRQQMRHDAQLQPGRVKAAQLSNLRSRQAIQQTEQSIQHAEEQQPLRVAQMQED